MKNNKYFVLGIGILILILCEVGATYAFFAVTATNTTAISGEAATAGLELTVTKNYPTSAKPGIGRLIPQLESALGSAMNTTNGCVDANNNVICQVYTITITNTGNSTAKLNGSIKFNHSGDTISGNNLTAKGMPNLKWRRTSGTSTLGSYTTQDASVITSQTIVSNLSLAAAASETYYIVIWINEINASQNDSGTFGATIEFVPSNGTGGITSTIIS